MGRRVDAHEGACTMSCPACGAELPAGFSFCGHCGTRIQAAPPPPPAEQRRRVAILFADLCGSTALVDSLDPEVAYSLIADCMAGLGKVVTEAGGYVAKTLGDGLMGLFGAPKAYGDDPIRGARASLAMQSWMREYSAANGHELQLRVGINYGSVVAGELVSGEQAMYDVLGDAVNTAQRLEAAAAPGTVCVSAAFYQLTRGQFRYEDLGAARVKGKPEPLQLYRLCEERQFSGGSQVLPSLPVVGRDRELTYLLSAVHFLAQGESSRIALVGPRGFGKSRLMDEVALELAELGIPALRATAGERGSEAPLSLWRRWACELLPISAGMSQSEATEAIRGALDEGDGLWAGWLAALALQPERLLALDGEAREPVLRASTSALLAFWQQDGPGALLVDEAGQLDELTLRLLLGASGRPGVLVLLADRDSAAFPPMGLESITLGPLEAGAVDALLNQALSGRDVPETLRERAVEWSGGSPLFLTLMLAAIAEAADPGAALAAVPDSLYGLVQAQLDALPAPAKVTAEAAAVLGQSFAERWLQDLAGQSASAGLAHLESRGMLLENQAPPERSLVFRQAVFREVLYEGLLRAQRQKLHASAAAAIEREAPARRELAARVSRHWREAEAWEPALEWTLGAAEYAGSIYAGEEARELYTKALSISERLGRVSEAARCQLGLAEISALRGDFVQAREGYERAAQYLESGVDDPVLLGTVLLGHARALGRTGANRAAGPLLARALELLAKREERPARRQYVRCLIERGHEQLELGDLDVARASAEEAIRHARAEGLTSEEIEARGALGRALTMGGEAQLACEELRRAAEMAEATEDWLGACYGWMNLGAALKSAGRLEEAAQVLHHGLDLAQRIGDAEKTAIIRLNLGTLHLNRGEWDTAADLFTSALGDFRAMEHDLGAAAALGNLADTHFWAGRDTEADCALTEAEGMLKGLEFPTLEVHLLITRAEQRLRRSEMDAAADLVHGALEAAEGASYEEGAALARLALGRATRDAEMISESLQHFDALGQAVEAARARGALARLTGDEELRRDALQLLEQVGAGPWSEHL